jgi:hypothetical protein
VSWGKQQIRPFEPDDYCHGQFNWNATKRPRECSPVKRAKAGSGRSGPDKARPQSLPRFKTKSMFREPAPHFIESSIFLKEAYNQKRIQSTSGYVPPQEFASPRQVRRCLPVPDRSDVGYRREDIVSCSVLNPSGIREFSPSLTTAAECASYLMSNSPLRKVQVA